LLDKMEAGGFIERRPDPADRRAWLLYLTSKAHPLIEVMRSNGQKTREEAFTGLSADAQQHLLQTLCLIKSNLLEACTQPAVDREKVHV
jgi:DNA-binding MarR family transcriptional regulator